MEGTSSFTHTQFAVSNRVAYIVLNRPPMNVLTIKMMREINNAPNLNAMCWK